MSATGDFDYEKTLQEFQEKLEECTCTAACGRQFVLVAKLRDWLRSNIEPHISNSHLQLMTAYRKRRKANIPLPADAFDAGPDCCLLVFCTLHMTDRGNLSHNAGDG